MSFFVAQGIRPLGPHNPCDTISDDKGNRQTSRIRMRVNTQIPFVIRCCQEKLSLAMLLLGGKARKVSINIEP